MRGLLITIHPAADSFTMQPLDQVPQLETLQAVVGGNIEEVASLDTIAGQRCVSFCNAEGFEVLDPNPLATFMWAEARKVSAEPGPVTVLHGPVAVIIGDDELLAAL